MIEEDTSTYYLQFDASEHTWLFLGNDIIISNQTAETWLAPLDIYPSGDMKLTAKMFAAMLNAMMRFEDDPFKGLVPDGQIVEVFRNNPEALERTTKLISLPNVKLLIDESGTVPTTDDDWVISPERFGRDKRHANFPRCDMEYTEDEISRYEFISIAQKIQIHAHVFEEALEDAGCSLPSNDKYIGSMFWSRRANEIAFKVCSPYLDDVEKETLKEIFDCEEWEKETHQLWRYVSTPPRRDHSTLKNRMLPVATKANAILRICSSYLLSDIHKSGFLAGTTIEDAFEQLGINSALEAYANGVPVDFVDAGITRREFR